MTSPTPLLYNTYYHIYNRGVNRGNIFFEARNYAYFLKLYEKHIAPVADTFAYCLLKNHFHLAIRVKQVVYSNIPSDACRSRRTTSSGM